MPKRASKKSASSPRGKRSASASKKTKSSGKKKSSKRTKQPPIKKPEGPQRLQRLLASAGYGSRRQCEELIEEGRVEVDGEIASKLGTTVDPKTQKVRVDGVVLRAQKKVYYAVHKPTGVVTTNRDPQGRPRVIDLVPRSERVFPVGRLDRSSEGLILLTNDGDLAQLLAHPKHGVRKIYRVTVAGKVEAETMRTMRKGIYIAEGFVKVEGARILKARPKATEMEIVLREGKNREIRRILARMGHKVQTLRRIAIGPLRLGDVPPGAYRLVSREEVRKLQAAAMESIETAPSEIAQRRTKPTKKRRTGIARSTPKTTAKKATSRKSKSAIDKSVRKSGRKSKPEFEIKLKSFDDGAESRIGSVIGGDSAAPASKAAKSKRSAGKRSGASSRSTKKSRPAKKRSVKKSSGPKKKARGRQPSAGKRRGKRR